MKTTRRVLRASCIAILLVFGLQPAGADVLKMKDGRVLRGTVVEESGGRVKFDALVGRMRAVLTVDRSDVASLERKALPPGFYDLPPAPSAGPKFRSGQVPYLEVPVVGVVGEDVLAHGIGGALRYAREHRIGHVVFMIDSTEGTVDEALLIYDRMKRYKGRVKFHAIVKNSVGPSLAVTAWCDTIHLQKGARLGGRSVPIELGQEEEDGVVRARLAEKVASETGRSPRGSSFLKAMIDPARRLFAWKADGQVRVAHAMPEGVSHLDLIVEVKRGEVLQLAYEQSVALGVPSYEGDAAGLGASLGIKGWSSAGDYGAKVVKRFAERRRSRAEVADAKFERRVERNLKRREEAEAHVNESLREAAAWDPTSASYDTYKVRWHWGWGIMREVQTGKLTKEAQQQWRTRTDACGHFLNEAARGLRSLRKLEKEGEKLGLEPKFAPGEIDEMLKDIRTRLVDLDKHRDKETAR